MANEIKLNISLQCNNGNFAQQFNPGQKQIDQAAQGFHGPVVTVGTTEEVVPTGDISTLGVLCGRNLDTSNYVTVGPSTGGAMYNMMRVEAGEPFALRLEPGVALRWKANTSAVKMQMLLFED
jgi:hypothetical protein